MQEPGRRVGAAACLLRYDRYDRYTNMAIDEAMWQLVGEGAYLGVARTYGWSDAPVVSLGFFQDAAWLEQHAGLRELPFVRRPTGGGAILHTSQVTFACAVRRDAIQGPVSRFARTVHLAIAEELARMGYQIEFGQRSTRLNSNALLCFERPDTLAGYLHGKRILGSAQRRSRSALLLHGVFGPVPQMSAEESIGVLERALVSTIGRCPLVQPVGLPAALEERAACIRDAKYATLDWNMRRRQKPRRVPAGEARTLVGSEETLE